MRRANRKSARYLSTIALLLAFQSHAQAPPPPVQITLDAQAASGAPWQPTSNWFGADEPNYLTTPAGRALLAELAHLSPGAPVYFRPHNLLTTGNGTPALKWGSTDAYTEDAHGRPVYNWTVTDRLFDAMVHSGVTPFVEIGFTPKALSPHPEPYQHSFPKGNIFTGWSYPPDDDRKWSALITAWVRHLHTRYGPQVELWRWEVWNEPDIPYFHGSPQQYFHLYDLTAAAVRAALPHGLVGGPATTGPYGNNTFLQDFLTHCAHGVNAATGQTGAPLDFISFHPKGSPKLVSNATGQPVPPPKSPAGSTDQPAPPDTHVQMGLYQQLEAIRNGFGIVAASPKFHELPIILSESDPEGCAACTGPANNYRNGEAYAASVLEATARSQELAREYHVHLLGAVNWAFIFPGQPPFAGFRELATALPDPAHPPGSSLGPFYVDKPVLNALRLLSELGGSQLPVANSGATPTANLLTKGPAHTDIQALATRRDHNGAHELDILLWNYSDSLAPAPPTPITLSIRNLPHTTHITQTELDHTHANSYTAWLAMGSPTHPTPSQVESLLQAAKLKTAIVNRQEESTSSNTLHVALERNGATLLRLSWR